MIDTSAVVAILLDEPDRRFFSERIEEAASRRMSTATYVETCIVIESRRGAEGLQDLDTLIDRAEIELIPVDERVAREARRGWSRFGKGRHPAGLNFGDCFSYALARLTGEPLLFKGDDFGQTDVAVVQ